MVGNEWQRQQGVVEIRLMEECSEVIQALTKGLRFGWDNFHPITKRHNEQIALEEMQDVIILWNEFAVIHKLPLLEWKG